MHEEPLVEALPSTKNLETASRIGFYVNQLVDDGATLQIGFGHLPYAILQHPDRQKGSGHSHPTDHRRLFAPVREKGDHQPQEDPAARKGGGIAVHGIGKAVPLCGQQPHVLPFDHRRLSTTPP
jgi:hypothetical protein